MKFTLRNANRPVGRPLQLRVPGVKSPVGLGTAIKRATTAMGVKPCSACEKRAEQLDRVATLFPRPDKSAGREE